MTEPLLAQNRQHPLLRAGLATTLTPPESIVSGVTQLLSYVVGSASSTIKLSKETIFFERLS